jgi:hypothetical protein
MQGFLKNMYKFIGVQLKSAMDQLKISMIFIIYFGLQTQVISM